MCTLRVSGAQFDVDAFLETSPFSPAGVFRRGEPRMPATQPDGKVREVSGMNISVSDASWSDLAAQVTDAERRRWVAERYRPAFHSYIEAAVQASRDPGFRRVPA